MIFFILVGGAPGTIWDHIKPKNGRKKGPKTRQKRPKIGPGRRHLGRRPISIENSKKKIPWPHGPHGPKGGPSEIPGSSRTKNRLSEGPA